MSLNLRCYTDDDNHKHWVAPGDVPVLRQKDGYTMLGTGVKVSEKQACLPVQRNQANCSQLNSTECNQYGEFCQQDQNTCKPRKGVNVAQYMKALRHREDMYSRLRYLDEVIKGKSFKDLTIGEQMKTYERIISEKQEAMDALAQHLQQMQATMTNTNTTANSPENQQMRQEQIQALQSSLAENNKELETLRALVSKHAETLKFNATDKEQIMQTMRQVEADKRKSLEKLAELQLQEKRLTAEHSKYVEELVAAAQRERRLQEQLGQTKMEMTAYQNIASRLQVDRTTLKSKITGLQDAEQILRSSVKERDEILARKQRELETARTQFIKLKEQAQLDKSELDRSLLDHKAMLAKANSDYAAASQNLKLVQAELQSVTDATQTYTTLMNSRVEAMKVMTRQIAMLKESLQLCNSQQGQKEAVMVKLVEQLRDNEDARRHLSTVMAGDKDFDALVRLLANHERTVVGSMYHQQPASIVEPDLQRLDALRDTITGRLEKGEQRVADIERKRLELEASQKAYLEQQNQAKVNLSQVKASAGSVQQRKATALGPLLDDVDAASVNKYRAQCSAYHVKQYKDKTESESIVEAAYVHHDRRQYEGQLSAVNERLSHHSVMLRELKMLQAQLQEQYAITQSNHSRLQWQIANLQQELQRVRASMQALQSTAEKAHNWSEWCSTTHM